MWTNKKWKYISSGPQAEQLFTPSLEYDISKVQEKNGLEINRALQLLVYTDLC
jgi:hypothetical protein